MQEPHLMKAYSAEHVDEVNEYNRKVLQEHADKLAKSKEKKMKQALPQDPNTETIELDTPIIRGDTTITTLTVKKPDAGNLRGGIKLMDLIQMDTDAIIKVVPRITSPVVTEHDVANLDPVDLLAVSTAVVGFFQPKAERAKAKANQAETK